MKRSENDRQRQVDEVLRLRKVEKRIVDACKLVGISPATFFRWHRKFATSTSKVVIAEQVYECMATFSSPHLRRLDVQKQTRIRRQIADLCISVFGHRPRPRLRRHQPEIEKLGRKVESAVAALDSLPKHLRDLVATLAEPVHTRQTPYAELLERLRAFPSELRAHTEALGQYAAELGEAAGGPDQDSRVGQLVTGLALIYQSATGYEPTHRISPDTGKAISSFNRFVGCVVRHFLPKIEISRSTLDRAMRDAAAAIDCGGAKPRRRKPRRRLS